MVIATLTFRGSVLVWSVKHYLSAHLRHCLGLFGRGQDLPGHFPTRTVSSLQWNP